MLLRNDQGWDDEMPSKAEFGAEAYDLRRVEAVLFDLDGTLVDSVPDIATALNRVIVEFGHPPFERDEVRAMVGDGIGTLVERAFAARAGDHTATSLMRGVQRMIEVYEAGLTVDTRPMLHAGATLSACAGAGLKLAVVTNKPEALATRIVAHFDFVRHVGVIVGGDSCATRKPDPEMLLLACRNLDTDAHRCVMIGDSVADIAAAKAAGMGSIAVRGGYTRVPAEELGADAVAADLGEVSELLEKLPVRT